MNYGNNEKAQQYLSNAYNRAKSKGYIDLEKQLQSRIEILKFNQTAEQQNSTAFQQEKENEQKNYIRNIEYQKAKSLEEIEKLSEENQLIELKNRAQQDEYEKKLLEEELEKKAAEEALKSEKLINERIAVELENEKLLSDKKAAENRNLFILLGALCVITVLILLGFLNKRKTNKVLTQKNIEISKQKDEIELKTKHINQSIDYATRIQKAILPAWNKLNAAFPNSFIYLNPKDKVSGDFFWIHQKYDTVFVSAADCTGHGVPGAFMSIIFSNVLDKIVNEYNVTDHAEILEKASQELEKMILDRGYSTSDFKDGMDIALLRISINTKMLTYAGAKNPVYIVRNEELTELKATRRSVNIVSEDTIKKQFKNETFKLEKGDRLFVFSDGFPDQKGGKEDTKFFYKPFREMLTSTSSLEIEKQKQVINETFNAWKGEGEQIDDVLIVGIEIS